MLLEPHSLLVPERGVSRRVAAQMVAAAALLPSWHACCAQAQADVGVDFWSRPRTVYLKRPATGEVIKRTYWANGALVEREYRELCWFLRDPKMEARMAHRRVAYGALPSDWYCAVLFSPTTLDILYALSSWLELFKLSPWLIVDSAFRHFLTNISIEGAARNSQHMRGGAVDIYVPGVSAEQVGRFAVWLRGGGVGIYPAKNFTHVDDGRLRVWRGGEALR